MKQKMKITFEVEESVIFKTRTRRTAFCEFCDQTVEILTTKSAGSILGLAEFQIFRLIESGNVHFIESEQIELCRKSLKIYEESLAGDSETFGSFLGNLARNMGS